MKRKLVPEFDKENVLGFKPLTDEYLKEYGKIMLRCKGKKAVTNAIKKFIKENDVVEEDMKVFNKILGDHKILNKVKICWDGSYTNGRIFYKNYGGEKHDYSVMSIDGEFWLQAYMKKNFKLDKMSFIEKINYMKNNFEVIYLHLVTDADSKRDEEMERWEAQFDFDDEPCYPEDEDFDDGLNGPCFPMDTIEDEAESESVSATLCNVNDRDTNVEINEDFFKGRDIELD